jgi:hypothetical protein
MNARRNRERLALRLNAWLAQEIGAGSMAQARTYGGQLTTTTYVLDDTRLNAPDLNDASELLAELALDLRCISELRAGKEVGARAWMLVAERLGTDGPLPSLAQVLDARRAYWAACDAAHDARRARDRGTTPKAHTRTPETPQAAPERAVEVWRYVEPVYEQGELVSEGTPYHDPQSYLAQLGWLEVHAELDAPRAQVGEPFERARWAPDLARQGVSVRKLEREARRLTPPAWMDEAPQWGEEVERG